MTLLAGACTIALLASVAWYGSALAGATATHLKIKGNTASATFAASDPSDSCLENVVSITASDRMEKVSPGEDTPADLTNLAILLVVQTDVCNDITLFTGQGETTDHVFQVVNDLSSATLIATVPVFDLMTLNFYDFDVDLTWTATAPAVREHLHERVRDREAGILINTQLRGRHSPAEAAGTVVGEGDTGFTTLDRNFTPAPSTSAEIMFVNEGSVSVEMSL